MSVHPSEQLSAYLDGELSLEQRTAVEAHLRACGECAAALAEMRAIDAASRNLPVEAPEAYFESFPGRVRGRLQRARTATPRRALWAAAAAAAVVAAVVVVSPLLMRARVAPGEPPAVAVPPAAAPEERLMATPAPTPAPKLEADRIAPPPAREQPPRKRLSAPAVRDAAAPAAPPAVLAPPATTPPPSPSPAAGAVAPEARGRVQEERFEEKPAAEALVVAQKAQRQARRDRAAAADAAASRAPAGFEPPPGEREYRQLISRWPASVSEARALWGAWRAWAEAHPEGTRADEARVRALQAGAEAWRLGRDERDRARLREEAAAYLRRPDALQRDRVRALLEEIR